MISENERQTETIKSAIVTGCTGSIGTALISVLIAEGISVFAVIRPSSQRRNKLPPGVTVIECDINKIDLLPMMINQQVDAFFHMAWAGTIGPERNNISTQIKNIEGTNKAVNACSRLGVKVFIGVGSQAEYGIIDGIVKSDLPCHPITGYGMAKLCAGQMSRLNCKMLGIRHEWVRILSVYGPNDGPMSVIPMMIRKLLNMERPALTRGEQKWDYLYSSDAADALLQVAKKGKDGKVYILGSGTVKPLAEYFGIIRDLIDDTLPLGLGEVPYSDQQIMHLQADIHELTKDTGFIPKVRFEDGIKTVIDTIRAEVYEEK